MSNTEQLSSAKIFAPPTFLHNYDPWFIAQRGKTYTIIPKISLSPVGYHNSIDATEVSERV